MNSDKRNELLREAASFGDEDGVKSLIEAGADVNAQHSINGWTPLHWAARRGHGTVVQHLLSQGADPSLISVYGESALSVTKEEDIQQMLSGCSDNLKIQKSLPLPITPNYLANPPLAEKVEMQEYLNNEPSTYAHISSKNFRQNLEEELVLKVRTSDPPNQDFIEIEIPLKNLSYENVFKICCEELGVQSQNVLRLRKLPNTIVRKDKDVLRFHNFQELELVLNSPCGSSDLLLQKTSISKVQSEINGCNNNNVQSALNSTLIHKSSYCKNGTILY